MHFEFQKYNTPWGKDILSPRLNVMKEEPAVVDIGLRTCIWVDIDMEILWVGDRKI